MMPSDRFDRRLTATLDEIAQPRTPDYFDDLLGLTARTRQRPAWTLLERWLPMVDTARQPAFVRQVPWRPIAVLVLILLLLAASLALVIGSRHSIPAPFGLARNGLVAYASAGDIYTADAVTGKSTAIVKGPETDANPQWSRDGTRVAFERMADGNPGSGVVFVARADGSDLIRVTPDPLVGITGHDFSPDGKKLLISAELNGIPSLFIAATDGSEIHQLNVGIAATNPAWRPPNGSEILFTDSDNGDPTGGNGAIHLVNSQGGDVRTIVDDQRSVGIYRGHPLWSPDGSLIAVGEWCDSDCSTGNALTVDGNTVQTYVVKADGSDPRILPSPAGVRWQAPERWSNDGSRMLVIRNYAGGIEQARPAVVPVVGSASDVEIPYPGGMDTTQTAAWEWAPDDSSILGTPTSVSGAVLDQVLLDPVKGTFRKLTWSSVSEPSWQRLAP
jgi:dipeptidyl aminopeptidase/acylaminoacyl peptidase